MSEEKRIRISCAIWGVYAGMFLGVLVEGLHVMIFHDTWGAF